MKKRFQEFSFRADTLAAIQTANRIVDEYERQGYRLTLRQLYYQHVARGLIENTERSYKRLGELISNARLAGLIDWDAIEDRTRNLRGLSCWDSPRDIIGAAASDFRIDKWERQPNHVEVWVEKDALVGVVERVCNLYQVDYFACRGYTSQSEMFVAAQRIAASIQAGKDVTIIHLGDHDPSGIDMTRDIRERLEMFLEGFGCDVNRLALNFDQVQTFQPPPNPAKTTDSRFSDYQRKFGSESWELDALEPATIAGLIEQLVLSLRDEQLWQEALVEEAHQRATLVRAAANWDAVTAYLAR